MKNFKLLLATTAILSVGVGVAVAPASATNTSSELSTEIKARINIFQPVTISSEGEIYFGNVQIASEGDKIRVTADGIIDEDIQESYGVLQMSSGVQAITIYVGGGLYSGEELYGDSEISEEYQQDYGNWFSSIATWSIPEITLTSGNVTCGEVVIDDYKYERQATGNKITGNTEIHLGGTFTFGDITASDMPARGALNCEGSTEATLVLAP